MNNIDEILRQSLILEGLARTLRDRDDADALDLLLQTITSLRALAEEIPAPEPQPEPIKETPEPIKETPEPEPAPEPAHVEEEPEIPGDEHFSVDSVTVDTDITHGQIRLDEMLSRREAKDLRKAFTLNDKFRFRRELFCNNDPLFISTLDTLQQMSTLEEALEYLRDTMGWDLEDEDVADFVAIITNHYL